MLDRVLDILMSHQQCNWFTVVANATSKIVFSALNFVETEKFQKGYFAKTSFGTKYSRMGQMKFVEDSLSIKKLKRYGLLKQTILL